MSLEFMYAIYIYIYTKTSVLGIHVYLSGFMSLEFMYIICIYIYIPGPMSLDIMYTYQDMSLDFMFVYQDFCRWDLCILIRIYVLGIMYVYIYIYVYVYIYIYQDLCPWNLYILARTYVLGIYVLTRTYVFGFNVHIPGLLSLWFMYPYHDLWPWIFCTYGPMYRHIYIYIDIYLWYLLRIIWYFNKWQHIHMYTLRTTKAPLRTLHTTKKTVTSLPNRQCLEQRHFFPKLIRNIVTTSVKDLSLASVHVCFC